MGSPSTTPENCSICLAQIENRSVIDGCMHAFCYSCLKEWSKVKAVCPLCKQPFTFFMHNIKDNDDFDKYEVPTQPSNDFNDHLQRFMQWENETNRVVDHWMSSRIHEWRQRIQQDQENARAAIVAATSVEIIRRRRRFYREGIQVSHVRNNKKVRDISSRFFRDNPPQVHRLVPWLKRELIILFGANNMMLVNRVCDLILSAVPTLGIQTTEFYDELKPYLRERTDHFLKEFISFATSLHDIGTYDSNARYTSSRRHRSTGAPSWNSDDDNEHPRRFLPHLYSTSLPETPPLSHVRNQISLERSRARNRSIRQRWDQPPVKSPPSPSCIVISSSSSADESEVQFVKFIKPPHLRTPDAVIALSSDEEAPGPSRPRSPLRRSSHASLSDQRPCSSKERKSSEDSDSSDFNVKLKSVVVPVKKRNSPLRRRSSGSSDSVAIARSTSIRNRLFNSDSSDLEEEKSPPRKLLKKVFDKKRSRFDNDFTRRLSRRWSSSSDSSNDDYASPYVFSSSRRSRKSK